MGERAGDKMSEADVAMGSGAAVSAVFVCGCVAGPPWGS